MKYFIILFAASTLLAADPPKAAPLPDGEQARIAKAQAAYERFSARKQVLAIQTEVNDTAYAKAQAEFITAINESMKAHGCASINESLECVPPAPKAEPKAEAKKEK